MSSSSKEGPVLSSSPQSAQTGSPVRRRDSSAVNEPRLSPTIRAVDPNDPKVMERQRTMDEDMAMHLSRARREPTSPKDDAFHFEADNDSLLTKRPSIVDLRDHLLQTQDPSLLVSLQASHNVNEYPSGLPSYTIRSNFDFGPMEQFAASQRAASPNVNDFSILGPEGSRTISEGTRVHRKGIGGKLALFEGTAEDRILPRRLDVFSPDQPSRIPEPATGHTGPYRFSFYSNALSATIHARSLSELPADGQSFEDLFLSTPSHEPKAKDRISVAFSRSASPDPGRPFSANKPPNTADSRNRTPPNEGTTWWLDVLNPTDEEMKMLSKVFSIHPLTTEDIQMEESREKIELFRNYYLVCFRSFDQDPYSPTHLEPLNMYILVFREGTLSFHFRPTPHPQNVRRRIKQLKDYISVTSDWISYALIDDITDTFGPLIQSIEYEVDSIDELVLILKEAEQSDMLRRIGRCRKKVMGLLRLMANKADVVKGLAKRCNENWQVAPTSDIGLYLSDIQDHLITMTQNLNHYEKILSRSHSNYLAQISIEMTDANNQINDVLSKLTALGTVLIPMNLVTGLWGMNVHVPGQNVEGFAWFISIIACLVAIAVVGGFLTYRIMVKRS